MSTTAPCRIEAKRDKNGLFGEQRAFLEEEIERHLSVHPLEKWESLQVYNFLTADGRVVIMTGADGSWGVDAWAVADLLSEKISARLTFRAIEIATARHSPLPDFLVERLSRHLKIVQKRGGAKAKNIDRWFRCVELVAKDPSALAATLATQVGIDEKTVKSWRAQWKFRTQVANLQLDALMKSDDLSSLPISQEEFEQWERQEFGVSD